MEVDDPYQLLGIEYDASETEIKKSYRKKALIYHPDKNPDNEVAAAMFTKIQKAYEFLSDPSKKQEFDDGLKGKLERIKRDKQMNAARRQQKDDLERRETDAKRRKVDEKEHEMLLKTELERLRQDNLQRKRALEEQVMNRSSFVSSKLGVYEKFRFYSIDLTAVDNDNFVRVKWSKGSNYTTHELRDIFSKFGDIENIVVKKREALLEYKKASVPKSLLSSSLTKYPELKPFSIHSLLPPTSPKVSSSNNMAYEADTLSRMGMM